MKPSPTTLGQRIKSHREKMGLTQRQLAKVVDVSYPTLCRYENDVHQPSIAMIKKLAKALKTTGDNLLSMDLREMSIQDTEELELVRFFRNLNEQGRKRLLDYLLVDFKEIAKYAKKP